MSDVTLFLPWPPSGLSPNARMHWHGRAKLASLYRHQCAWTAIDSCRPFRAAAGNTRLAVSVTFCPPDRRRRDLDNCVSAFKSGADGIADACGIDDSRWIVTYLMDSCRPGGEVVVRLGVATKGEA